MPVYTSKSAVAVCLMVAMARWMTVRGQEEEQEQLFTDERAGYHIDNLSEQGIRLKIQWRERFLASLSAIDDTLNEIENSLDTDYSAENVPNITVYAMTQMDSVLPKLNQAETKVEDLGLNNTEDGLVAFMTTPASLVDVQGNFDPTATASGTFYVPQYGLYQITARSTTGSGVNLQIMRNGNETLSNLVHGHYYDIKTRISLAWLNENDQIFITGGTASYFGVMLLRVQTLMPRFV